MKVLSAVALEKCIGCHTCSLACARLVHQSLSWNRAGIRIKSAGGLTTGFEAVVCLACQNPACAAACPTGACVRRKDGGVRIDKKKCVHCASCVAACPVNAMYFDPDWQTPVVCVHCGQCVDFCPHGCLELAERKVFSHNSTA